MYRRLSLNREFFSRDAREVARELLGKTISCRGKVAVITETEAYLGPEDLASHARFGQTARNRIMWGPAGHLYVYLIYGMYEMANIITGPENFPSAVLLRSALVKESGQQIMGPGRLSKYLGITREDYGTDMVTSPTLFCQNGPLYSMKVVATPRIGIDYAGVWAKKKWRYVAVTPR